MSITRIAVFDVKLITIECAVSIIFTVIFFKHKTQ
jgi:hypothetical protein